MRFKWPPVLAVSRVKSHELPRVVDKVSGALGRSWKSEELGARRGWRLLQQGSVETSAWKLFNEFLLHENAFARGNSPLFLSLRALETRLRIVGCLKAILLIVLPDTPVIFSLVSALEGLLLSLSFRSRGEENGGRKVFSGTDR